MPPSKFKFMCNGNTRCVAAYLLFIICMMLLAQPCELLRCYNCSESFESLWHPQICQMNVTLAPVTECRSQEKLCFVKKIKVSDQVVYFARGCAEDCSYECTKFEFVISSLTCTTCCGTELCNTGDGAVQIQASSYLLLHVFLLFILWSRERIR